MLFAKIKHSFPHLLIATRARVPSEAHATNITAKPWIWQITSPNNHLPVTRTAIENGANRSNITMSDIARDITKYAGMFRRRWFLYRTRRTATFPTVPINTMKAYRKASPAADAVERDNNSSCRDEWDLDVVEDMIVQSTAKRYAQRRARCLLFWERNDCYSLKTRFVIEKKVSILGGQFICKQTQKPDY